MLVAAIMPHGQENEEPFTYTTLFTESPQKLMIITQSKIMVDL